MKMKVLKIIHTLGHGGAENTFRWLAVGLQGKGLEVVAAIPFAGQEDKENWVSSALKESGIHYVTFDKTGSPLQLLNNLTAILDYVRPDVVHSHLLDSNFYAALACRRRNIPHVCTEHGDVSFNQSLNCRMKYSLISIFSHLIVCVSEAVREKASSMVLVKKKLRTVYNGIKFFEKRHSSFQSEFNIPGDAVIIGSVGNLYPVKGQKYLIKAFADIRAGFPKAYLVIVGRGGEEATLKQLVRDLRIPTDSVIFTGFRQDIENIMNSFDLYVQPSLSEGHPVAVLEAMSLGIPVIATAVGGIPEVTSGNKYGTLVLPGSSEDLIAVFREFRRNQLKFNAKALPAEAYIRSEFTLEKMAANYIQCYQEVLARGDSHRQGRLYAK